MGQRVCWQGIGRQLGVLRYDQEAHWTARMCPSKPPTTISHLDIELDSARHLLIATLVLKGGHIGRICRCQDENANDSSMDDH